jgi:hypothetical protein
LGRQYHAPKDFYVWSTSAEKSMLAWVNRSDFRLEQVADRLSQVGSRELADRIRGIQANKKECPYIKHIQDKPRKPALFRDYDFSVNPKRKL